LRWGFGSETESDRLSGRHIIEVVIQLGLEIQAVLPAFQTIFSFIKKYVDLSFD
jgi:hypothetical protein